MAPLPTARVFAPRPLDPVYPDGFSARWFYFTRALGARFAIDAVAVRDAWHRQHATATQFRPPMALQRFQALDAEPPGGVRKVLGTLDARWQVPHIPGVREALQPPPDLAVFFQHFLAPLAFRLPPRTPCVFVLEENVVALHTANRLLDPDRTGLHRVAERSLADLRARRFGRLVASCGRRGPIVAISEAERATLARWTDAAGITVIPNGVDPDEFAPRAGLADHDVGIFGNLGHARNHVPARALVEAARERGLPLRWLLVGRDPHPSLRALAGEGVTVAADVADPREFYPRARVVVVPARVTAGSKSTLLKAWAMGRPVIATPESAAGVPARHGHNLLVAEGPAAILGAAQALLADPQRAAQLGAAGRRSVVESCDLRMHAHAFAALCARTAALPP